MGQLKAKQLGYVLAPDNPQQTKKYACKYCKQGNFVWMHKDFPNGTAWWRLVDPNGVIHQCKSPDMPKHEPAPQVATGAAIPAHLQDTHRAIKL